MTKNFKDLYKEGLEVENQANANVAKKKVELAKTPVAPKAPDIQNFSEIHERAKIKKDFLEANRQQIVEEIKQTLTEELRGQVEAELKAELLEEISKDVEARVLKEAFESLERANGTVVEAIANLSKKIENLTENLEINIPTPVVNVTMPKTKKKVVYDKNGRIESVEDVEED